MTIFSQYGEPTYINLMRDKETGKSRGFAFLKYEDQRSTDLAVDNLGGSVIMGRTLNVDHTRYKKRDDEPDEGLDLTADLQVEMSEGGSDAEPERPMLREERELAILIRDHDDDDPMKAFLIEEKKDEVAKAVALLGNGTKTDKEKSSRHKHRSQKSGHEGRDRDRRHRSRRGYDDREKRRSRTPERSSHRRDDYADDRRSRMRSPTPEKRSRRRDDYVDDERSRRRSRTPEKSHRRRGSGGEDDRAYRHRNRYD